MIILQCKQIENTKKKNIENLINYADGNSINDKKLLEKSI